MDKRDDEADELKYSIDRMINGMALSQNLPFAKRPEMASSAMYSIQLSQMNETEYFSPAESPQQQNITAEEEELKRLEESITKKYQTKPASQIYEKPQETKPKSAYDKLLAEESEDEIDEGHKHPETYHDTAFSMLFYVSFAIMAALGVTFWIVSKTKPRYESNIQDYLYFSFSESYGYICGIMLLSFGIGLLWIALIGRFVKPALWMTIYLIPAAFFAVALLSLKGAVSPGELQSESQWLIPESIASFLLGVVSSVIIHKKRTNIRRSIALVELSFQILKENPGIILSSLQILMGYFMFCIVWLACFSSIQLLGHVEEADSQHPLKRWIPDPSSPWIIGFFLFVFMWASITFSYVERCMISGVVCEWYFHRNNPMRQIEKKNLAKESLKRSLTYTFGSICFASLVLSLIQAFRAVVHLIKRVGRWTVSDTVAGCFASCAALCESLIDGINSFALVYIAYNGTDFCTASRNCAYLFRRNLVSAILMDNVTRLLLLFGVYAVSLASFLGTMSFAVGTAKADVWFVSAIGALLPFYMLRFCSFILLQVMDAVYVCYVIDLDTNQCHSQIAHSAFTGDKNAWENPSDRV